MSSGEVFPSIERGVVHPVTRVHPANGSAQIHSGHFPPSGRTLVTRKDRTPFGDPVIDGSNEPPIGMDWAGTRREDTA